MLARTILLVCLLGSVLAWGDEGCPVLYQRILGAMGRDYHEGTLVSVTSIGKVPVPEGAKVYRLGSGGEATVYRVVPKSGEPYVLRHENGRDANPPQVFFRQMAFVQEVLSDSETGDPLPTAASFRAAGVKKTEDPAVFRLDNVEGFDLETVLDQVGHDSPEGKKLRDRFDALSRDFVKRAPDVVAKAKGQLMRGESASGYKYGYYDIQTGQAIPGSDLYVGTAIVWRNVIVDPKTQALTIIDPY